jgi:hypothetical protein
VGCGLCSQLRRSPGLAMFTAHGPYALAEAPFGVEINIMVVSRWRPNLIKDLGETFDAFVLFCPALLYYNSGRLPLRSFSRSTWHLQSSFSGRGGAQTKPCSAVVRVDDLILLLRCAETQPSGRWR